jgi:hypothetical protein
MFMLKPKEFGMFSSGKSRAVFDDISDSIPNYNAAPVMQMAVNILEHISANTTMDVTFPYANKINQYISNVHPIALQVIKKICVSLSLLILSYFLRI